MTVAVCDTRYGLVHTHASHEAGAAQTGDVVEVRARRGGEAGATDSRLWLVMGHAVVAASVHTGAGGVSLLSAMGRVGATAAFLAPVSGSAAHPGKPPLAAVVDVGSGLGGGRSGNSSPTPPTDAELMEAWGDLVAEVDAVEHDGLASILKSRSERKCCAAIDAYLATTAEGPAAGGPSFHTLAEAAGFAVDRGYWRAVSLLLRTRGVSCAACPRLVTTLVKEGQWGLLRTLLNTVGDLPESDLMVMLQVCCDALLQVTCCKSRDGSDVVEAIKDGGWLVGWVMAGILRVIVAISMTPRGLLFNFHFLFKFLPITRRRSSITTTTPTLTTVWKAS